MDGRYIDFDAARAERRQEPLRLRAFGQEFELPGSMPASLFLDVVRMEKEQGGQSVLTTKDAIGLLSRVIPEDVLDSLVAQPGFTLDDLIELARMVMAAYTGAGSGGSPGPEPGGAPRQVDPGSGLPRWIDQPAQTGPLWSDVLPHWALLEADFQEHYHLDINELLDQKTDRWLKVRIIGLLACDSRLHRVLFPPENPEGGA